MSLPPPEDYSQDPAAYDPEQHLFEWISPDRQWVTRAIRWDGDDDDMSRDVYVEHIVGRGCYRFAGERMVKITYPAVPVLEREEVTVERMGPDPATLEVYVAGEWRPVEPGTFLMAEPERYVNAQVTATEAGVVKTPRGKRVRRELERLMAEGKSFDDAIGEIASKDMPYDEMIEDDDGLG